MFHVEQGAGVVAGLADTGREIAGVGLEPGRSTGFKAEKVESEAHQGGGELVYRGAAVAGTLGALFADPDAPAERGTSGNDDGLRAELAVASGRDGEWLGGGIITQRHRGTEGWGWGVLDRINRIYRIRGLWGWEMFHVEQG